MKNRPLTISVVIPNWNGRVLLERHLPTIVARSAVAREIIVVDDGSTDDSCEFVKKNYPNIVIVQKQKNEGFASTVNIGVKKAASELVCLLNTDVLPEKGYLEAVIPHFANPKVFAVGSLDKSHEGNRVVDRGRGLSRWERGFYIHKRGDVNKSTTAWVAGGSGTFRRSVWLSLAGMDTLYNPFYWEDIDLSYRAIKAGYSLIFEPKSIVHHMHTEGAITKHFSPWVVKRIAYRNQFIFHWKNISDGGIIVSHLAWLPVRLIQACFRLDTAIIVGFFGALLRLPRIIPKRLDAIRRWKLPDDACVLPK